MKIFTTSLLLLFVVGLELSAQPVFNWTSQEIKAGRNLQKMTVFNNEAVIAGYGRTFVKSSDQGATWNDTKLLKAEFDFIDLSFKGNTGIAAVNRAKLYDAFPDVYSNGALLMTTDAGATWKNIDLTNLGSGDNPATDPTSITCFGLDFQSVGVANDSVAYTYLRWMEYKPTETSGYVTHSAVFKTTNKGLNWKILTGDLGSNIISTIVFADTTGYLAGNKMLYKTSIKTDSLINIFPNMNTAGAGYVGDITLINKDELYVTTTTNGVFKSTDGGATFTKFTISGVSGGWDLYKVGANTLVLGGNSGKSRVSNDGGTTWLDCQVATAIWEIPGVFNDSLYLLAKSEIYKIAITDLTAGTFTWKKQLISQDNNLQKASAIDANKMIIVGNGQTFKITTDKAKTWNDITFPAVPLLDDDIDFNGLRNIKDTAYACINRIMFADYPSSSGIHDIYWSGGLFKTTDNWKTFTNLDAALIGKNEGPDVSKNPQLPACNGLNTSVIEYLGNNVILLWARWYDVSGAIKVEHSRIFKSSDAGKNWKVVSDDFLGVYVMDIKFNGNTGYVGGNKIFLKSVDGGETFTNIYANLDTGDDDAMFINSITLGDANELFVVTATDGNFMSKDGGATFTKLSTAGGANDFYKFDSNSWMFLGSSGKSMFTNDAGANWLACHPAATIYEIGGVWNETFYALGQGKIYKLPIADLQLKTNVPVTQDPGGLTVVYRPTSVVLISSGETIEQCRIYNTLGSLISVQQPASNSYEIMNGAYPQGVYIIRSLAGGKIFTSKILLK